MEKVREEKEKLVTLQENGVERGKVEGSRWWERVDRRVERIKGEEKWEEFLPRGIDPQNFLAP